MIKKYFKQISGFYPYSFQKEVVKHILEGDNIILQAPTGAGKTWAAIMPFLIANEENYNFPSKLIYSLPLRTLTHSIKKEIESQIKKAKLKTKYKISVQTGELPEDPKFLGDIIFTTIDQSLSSFLNIPVGLSRRMGNINAGAVLSSYLIFDEVHLLEPEKSFFVMLELLKTTKMPFIIMTATLPSNFISFLQDKLNAKYVSVEESDIQDIACQKDKVLSLQLNDVILTAKNILNHHYNKTIVICNTVDKAQILFSELKKQNKNSEIFLLHSRFLGRDRKKKEEKVKRCFSKKSRKKDVILVSTQVIEAGLDISCDTMHTEIAPIDSLLQRFGRCARYEGETGKVFIYNVKKSAPYKKELCDKTWNFLKERDYKKIKFSDLQFLQDSILSDYYDREVKQSIIDKDAPNNEEGLKLLNQTIDESEKSNYQRLIRSIDGINLILHSHPEKIINPYEFETVSISVNQLSKFLSEINLIDIEDWILKTFEYSVEQDKYEYQDLKIEGRTFSEIKRELSKEFLLIINPKHAYYDKEVGFVLKEHFSKIDNFIKIKNLNEDYEKYSYRRETWIEHTLKVFKASFGVKISYPRDDFPKKFYSFRGNINFILKRYAKAIGVNQEVLKELLNLSLLLHDYGKLRKSWQKEARRWQVETGRMTKEEAGKLFFAHTDYDPIQDNGNPKFPTHAGIGAVAISGLIYKFLKEKLDNNEDIIRLLIQMIISVIARHHVPVIEKLNRDNSNYFEIEEGAVNEIDKLVEKQVLDKSILKFKNDCLTKMENENIDIKNYFLWRSNLNNQKERDIYSLYQIFVRILRLSDNYSFYID